MKRYLVVKVHENGKKTAVMATNDYKKARSIWFFEAGRAELWEYSEDGTIKSVAVNR